MGKKCPKRLVDSASAESTILGSAMVTPRCETSSLQWGVAFQTSPARTAGRFARSCGTYTAKFQGRNKNRKKTGIRGKKNDACRTKTQKSDMRHEKTGENHQKRKMLKINMVLPKQQATFAMIILTTA
ncbi:MAG: hypothetical protein MUD08_04155 [Cytophagales bacterium]|nr:hypothetical protein [Cytophagales bacterium]